MKKLKTKKVKTLKVETLKVKTRVKAGYRINGGDN